jgi:hypothetical protein
MCKVDDYIHGPCFATTRENHDSGGRLTFASATDRAISHPLFSVPSSPDSVIIEANQRYVEEAIKRPKLGGTGLTLVLRRT